MQQLLIEVSYEDQIYVENECMTKGYTITSFFKLILDRHKERGLGVLKLKEVEEEKGEVENESAKKRGRPAKSNQLEN